MTATIVGRRRSPGCSHTISKRSSSRRSSTTGSWSSDCRLRGSWHMSATAGCPCGRSLMSTPRRWRISSLTDGISYWRTSSSIPSYVPHNLAWPSILEAKQEVRVDHCKGMFHPRGTKNHIGRWCFWAGRTIEHDVCSPPSSWSTSSRAPNGILISVSRARCLFSPADSSLAFPRDTTGTRSY